MSAPHSRFELSPLALVSSTAITGYSWVLISIFVFRHQATTAHSEALLYGVAIGSFAIAGLIASWLSKRLPIFELLLSALMVCGGALLYGRLGLDFFPPSAADLDLKMLTSLPPGPTYLGPTWIRDIIAITLIGFLQAVVTASFVALMQAGGWRRDPQLGFEFFVSRRFLQAQRQDARVSKTALIAALGVCFGVAALITVVSAMSGYQAEVKDKILQTNAHLIVQKWGHDFTDYAKVQEDLAHVPGVVASSPFIFTGGMLAAAHGMLPVLVKGVHPQLIPKVVDLQSQLKHVELKALLPARHELPGVLIGAELMKELELSVGDEVALVSPVPAEGKRGAAPQRMRLQVRGEFQSGMHEFDQKLVYVGLDAGQTFIGQDSGVTGLEIKVNDPDQVEIMGKRVLDALGGWPYRTIDWRQLNKPIFSSLNLQKLLMVLILLFIIVVAAFNIASTLFMLVVEKTHDIAILKAMGAKDSTIMKIFVIEGHLIGLVGIMGGIVLGFATCALLSHLHIHIAADVYMVDTLRVVIRPSEVLLTVLGAIEVAHLATLYPALRAARTYPVEALRYG